MTTLLLIDVGNTRAKWWLEAAGHVIAEGACASEPTALATALGDRGVEASVVALASVASVELDADFVTQVSAVTGAPVHLCRPQASYLGLHNSYDAPATMGVDRWLAMLAAWQDEGRAVAVIDVGTAITIDLVSAKGEHEGGYILPGPVLMQESLVARTKRIDVRAEVRASLRPGQSTAACVAGGAWLAAAGAVREVATHYPDHHLVVCGGDAEALLGLGFNAEWRPGLVREGLSRWLRHELSHA